jgi:lysozyme family protein
MEEKMLSHVNLIEAILASKQLDLSRRAGRLPHTQNVGESFEKVLKNNLQVSSSVLPLNNEIAQGNAKFREGLKFVFEREGSKYVREDGGRESSKYGILQSTAKECGFRGNVRNLTKADAEIIYRKIWDKSGAESLPFPLSTVHFDTYVNSPSAAEKILSKSHGNIDVYLRLREQRYARLADIRPEQYGKYLKGWNNRIKNLRIMVASYNDKSNFTA